MRSASLEEKTQMIQTTSKQSEGNSITSSSTESSERVSSNLAGNVVAVLLAAGSVVEEGQPVIVLESMKMETEVNAPKNGCIHAVFVEEGDAVEIDDLLFSLE